MALDIYNLVQYKNYISFVELQKQINGFSDPTATWVTPGNVVIWHGISAGGRDAIVTLMNNNLIFIAYVSPYLYLMDGYYTSLPITYNIKSSYKKPHWIPIVLQKMN